MKWYVLIEQTHNDLGWIHPVKRTRDVRTVDLPGTIKHERTAYKWASEPGKRTYYTCKTLWTTYGQFGRCADPNPDLGPGWGEGTFVGIPYWSDAKCAASHGKNAHWITDAPRFKVVKGWRITRVTQDARAASTWTSGQAR